MATSLKLRRGTTTQHSTFTGAEGEVTVDTTKDTVVVHDGSTAGGFPLAKETGSTIAVAAGTVSAPSLTTSGDTNTGVFFPAADTIAAATGGTERLRIDSSGNVGIGTSSPSVKLDASSSASRVVNINSTNANGYGMAFQNSGTDVGYIGSAKWTFSGALNDMSITTHGAYNLCFGTNDTERMRINSSGNVGIGVTPSAWNEVSWKTLQVNYGSITGNQDSFVELGANEFWNGSNYIYIASANASRYRQNEGVHSWHTAASGTAGGTITFTERARITSGGDFLVGKTADTFSNAGSNLYSTGQYYGTANASEIIRVNRLTNDGDLIRFYQDTIQEGSISVSGNTVSYNAFTGGHWSQLQQGRGYNPDILRGTVMSTIGEMCDWKSVEWTETIEHPAVPAVEAKDAVLDEEGNVIEPAVEAVEGKDAWTETIPHREAYLGQLPVGATFEEDGVTKTVVNDGNERLPKVKISDVVGDKAVYGVFQTYDDVQDMLVTSLGAFVVRIAAGVTVQIGDLLESNGDGCAKVQDDDVIRSKTIGKVTSITPSATYADGSYTVPAVLYCG